MLSLPISDQLASVARYYQAWCTRATDIDTAHEFERAVEELPPEYKARALQAAGVTYHKCGELDTALRFYLAAGKAAASCDWLTLVESQQVTAVVRGINGDHKQAVADLEKLFPLARAVGKYYPATFYNYLNALAVELGEVGRVKEAQAACAIAIASPFTVAFPEWTETRDELVIKLGSASPSVVAIHRAPEAQSSTELQPRQKSDPSPTVVLSRSANNLFCIQRSTPQSPAKVRMVLNAVGILDRMLICISPRAPPSRDLASQ